MTSTRFDPDELAALEEQRDFLLGSLDDLERERDAGDIDEHDYLTLRDDYTARAAAVLRAIDAQRTVTPRPPRRIGRTVVGVVVVLGLAGGAGWAVAASSGARRSGDLITGDIRESSVSRLREAEALVGEGKVLEAIRTYDEVLADDPENPQALTYKGWLLVSVGTDAREDELVDRGEQLLERAMRADPRYPDAFFFYGFLLWRVRGDAEGATASFQHVLASDPPPPMEAEARRALDELAAEQGD